MARFFTILGISLPLILTLTDLLARWASSSSIPAIIWLMISLFVLASAASDFLIVNLKSFRPLSTLVIFILIGGSLFLAADTRFIQHENTQQLSCVLSKLSEPDLGFFSSCFLGYPTRGYYVSATPTLILGRTPFALNVGQHLLFYGGILAFAAGVLRTIPSRKGELYAVFGLIAGMASTHFSYLFISFEQSFTPLSLSFLFTGFFLLYLATSRIFHLSLASCAAIMAAYSYTPALALSSVAAALLLLIALNRRTFISFLMFISVTTSTAIGTHWREDLRISPSDTCPAGPLSDLARTLRELTLIWSDNMLGDSLTLVTLVVLIVSGIILAIIRSRPLQSSNAVLGSLAPLVLLIVLTWSVATVFVAVRAPGYACPDPGFALHRASVIFPLISGMAIWGLALSGATSLFVTVLLSIMIPLAGKNLGTSLREKIAAQPQNLKYQLLQQIASFRKLGFFSEKSRDLFMEYAIEDPFLSILNVNLYFPTIDLFQRIDKCESISKGQASALLLRMQSGTLCGNWRAIRCFNLNVPYPSRLELCEIHGLQSLSQNAP